ncbi:MAG: CoB--CoM heterodisulfide reductase iron-sulfur subunit B family protein [Candidatus Hodarchaeota archaeon]
MSYDIYLGCVIHARLPYLEASARKVFDKLGIKLNDVDGFSCCPDPTGVELISHKSWLAMGARNLSLCNKNGGVMSLCSGCVETLKGVNHALNHNEDAKAETNEVLKKIGKSYDGSVKVSHFAEVLYNNLEKVKEKVEKPLEGFKVAVHYGCHYLRPSEIIQWDDPFDAVTVDAIVEALGAESIPYDLKMECCGNPVSKSDKEVSNLILKKKLEAIKASGANCVVVVCPACYQQYEFQQSDINKTHETDFKFPIFYLSELVALALGLSYDDIGLKFHRVKVKEMLTSLQFA